MKTTVTKKAIREMVNEVLDNKEYGLPYSPEPEATPVVVDATVDPSAAVTNPGDPTFNPSDNRELSVAIHDIVKVIPDESIGPFYKKVKQVADDMLGGRDLSAERSDKIDTLPGEDETMKNEDQKVEEAIRLAVRKILREMNEENGDEQLAPTGTDTTVPPGDVAPQKTRRAHGAKASSGLGKELTPWADVASAMTEPPNAPMSVSGAKQMGDKAWRKARFMDYMFPSEEEKQAYMADLVNQYIDYLDSSDELTDDDFALLRDNPDMVTDLEGFQEFLMDDLRDAGYYPDIEFDKHGKPIFRDEKSQAAAVTVTTTDDAPATGAPAPAAAPRAPKTPKAAYKIYGKKGTSPAHTRLKGQAYGAPAGTAFRNGEQASATPEDGKLRVKKLDGDHTQLWDPVDG